MINLIPPVAKKSIILEYWVRVFTVWLLLIAFAVVVGISVLLPPYVLVTSQVDVYTESAEQASAKIATYENVSVDLIKASQQARIIVDSSKSFTMSRYIYLFESLQNPGISLSQIKLLRTETGIAPISLSGIATNRQMLADFRDRLLDEEEVSTVDLPISNLAKDKDINFSIIVVMNKKQES